jgi:glycosyltransferase involved in cell wall biosynthesis
MDIKVVSESGVASFNRVANDVVHVLREEGHNVVYQDWAEATIYDSPSHVLIIAYAYWGTIAYCQRWFGQSKVLMYCPTEGLPVLDAYSRRIAERMNFITPSRYCEGMFKIAELPNVQGVVPHGIDMHAKDDEEYNRILREFFPDPVILCIAENGIRKGLDKLLVAFKLVKREMRDVKLILHTAFKKVTKQTVSGHYDLMRLRKMLQLDPKDVWITDMYAALTSRQVQSLYHHAKVYAMSSLSEGFGLPIVEAMRWNRPSVALNYLPFVEIIEPERTGLVVDRVGGSTWHYWPQDHPRIHFELKHYDVEDYADQLIRLLANPNFYETIQKNISGERMKWERHNTYPEIVEYF